MRFGILDGPIDAPGSRWYRVEAGALTGWVAAASPAGDPWLASVHNGRIAFGAYAPAQAGVEILSMAFDGTDVKQLATIPMVDAVPAPLVASVRPVITCGGSMTPAWSRGGEWLSMIVSLDCNGVIFALRPDGGALLRVAEGQRASWAPTGTTLAYDLNLPYCGGPVCGGGPWDLFAVRLPDARPLRLTDGAGPNLSFNPLWSPDGQQIAFTRGNDGQSFTADTYLVRSDGTGEHRLTSGSVVRWLSDGSGVYVSRTHADFNGSDLFLVDLNGAERRVAEVVSADLSPDGTWMLTDRTDPVTFEFTRLLARVDGTEEVPLPPEWAVQGWSADGLTLLVSASDPNGLITRIAVDLTTGALTTIHYFQWAELPDIGGFAVQPVLVTDL